MYRERTCFFHFFSKFSLFRGPRGRGPGPHFGGGVLGGVGFGGGPEGVIFWGFREDPGNPEMPIGIHLTSVIR